jgi:putative transposase
MANTYTQLYAHLVFAVHGRESLIPRSCNDELQKYITGIVQSKGDTMIAINNEPDHMHILSGYKPSRAISDIVRDIKSNSSRFIREAGMVHGKFEWQEGYAAFSCSKSAIEPTALYIANQQEHHHKRTFREEYFDFISKAGIEIDPKYGFVFVDADLVKVFGNAAPKELKEV